MNDKNISKTENITDDKIQVNFYLSTKTLEKIEDLLFYAKKRLPLDKRRKLTKSIFYENCFNIIINEYNLKGEESVFWKSIKELMSEVDILSLIHI